MSSRPWKPCAGVGDGTFGWIGANANGSDGAGAPIIPAPGSSPPDSLSSRSFSSSMRRTRGLMPFVSPSFSISASVEKFTTAEAVSLTVSPARVTPGSEPTGMTRLSSFGGAATAVAAASATRPSVRPTRLIM